MTFFILFHSHFLEQKRNDREEIRRRLAMGAEDDYLTKISTAKPGRKPSLQTRLQEGKSIHFFILMFLYLNGNIKNNYRKKSSNLLR